jgi:hypothetical protein
MANKKLFWAKVILALLTLVAAISFYQVIFCAWMTAYSPGNAGEWRGRFYIRLATSLIVGILWIAAVVWLIRQKRRSGTVT